YYALFHASGQDAVRWTGGGNWEDADWEIRVGEYDTSGINSVEDRWEKHDRLTELMQRIVPRLIANTREHLDRFGRHEQLTEEDIARLGTFSHAAAWAPGKPLYQARLKSPAESSEMRKPTSHAGPAPHPKPFITHTVKWSSPPRFFVHEENNEDAE